MPPSKPSKPRSQHPEPETGLSFIDVHCHLPIDFSPKNALPTPEEQYQEFLRLGGTYLISSAIDWPSTVEIQQFALTREFMGYTSGWAPQTVTFTPPAAYATQWEQWKAYVTTHPEEFLAIGEIGVDFHHARTLPKREKQVEVFRSLLQIALDLKKPIVLHVRNAAPSEVDLEHKGHPFNAPDGANATVLKVLAEVGADPRRVMWHCFSGPASYGIPLSKQGFLLSVPSSAWGNPKWARNAAEVPVSSLLAETDASFQHPWKGGPFNVPANVRYSIAAIASLHNMSQQDAARQTTANAIKFFHLESKIKK